MHLQEKQNFDKKYGSRHISDINAGPIFPYFERAQFFPMPL